jgi:predicted  nucleic acid-binding Zn-ribbon protein
MNQRRPQQTGGNVLRANASATETVLSNLPQQMGQLRTELQGYQSRITSLHAALQAEKTKAKRALKLYEDLERIATENSLQKRS